MQQINIDGETFYIGCMLDEAGETTQDVSEVCTLIVTKHPPGIRQDYWSIPIEKGSMEPEVLN